MLIHLRLSRQRRAPPYLRLSHLLFFAHDLLFAFVFLFLLLIFLAMGCRCRTIQWPGVIATTRTYG